MSDYFEHFATSIVQLNRSIQRIKTAEMEKFGLKGSHTMCLYTLGRYPEGLTSAQLAARCREDKAAVSRTLTQLEHHGLVCAQSSAGKLEYRARLFLTPRGKEVVEALNDRVCAALEVGSAGLTAEQMQTLRQMLDLIVSNLQHYAAQ